MLIGARQSCPRQLETPHNRGINSLLFRIKIDYNKNNHSSKTGADYGG